MTPRKGRLTRARARRAVQIARASHAAVDMVNSPPHYTTGKIEVLDFIEDQGFGYLDGQVIKYVSRHRHKGAPVEDLKKARFYLNRLITRLEGVAV